ncbi:MAG: PIN domain-containing protein, partial [Selenomonadaceae bacterium]|nr:PIN domain-containing protein [Selenomonadaceae bacterium]
MANYCLDSNVVSDILRRQPEVMRHLNEALDNDDNLFISSIVYYEVVRGLKAAGKTRMLKEFDDFYANAKHLYLDQDDLKTIDKAVEIYIQLHKGKMIEDNDIYIAAISMVNGCTLVTSNTKHFSRVEGLNFVNWRSHD